MARMPWKLTHEWTTVLPEDSPMAIFVNGQVDQGDEHEPLKYKRGALYCRRVVIWRARWKQAEVRGWDAAAGDWEDPKVPTNGPEVPTSARQSVGSRTEKAPPVPEDGGDGGE